MTGWDHGCCLNSVAKLREITPLPRTRKRRNLETLQPFRDYGDGPSSTSTQNQMARTWFLSLWNVIIKDDDRVKRDGKHLIFLAFVCFSVSKFSTLLKIKIFKYINNGNGNGDFIENSLRHVTLRHRVAQLLNQMRVNLAFICTTIQTTIYDAYLVPRHQCKGASRSHLIWRYRASTEAL